MSTKEGISMSILRNPRHSSTRTAALRVTHQSIRPRAWASPTDPEKVITGEVNHIEATGFIAIDDYHPTRGEVTDKYQVTVHFNAPVGDGVVPHLGDNIMVTIRRAEGPEEGQYETDFREIAPQLVGLPAELRDAIQRNADKRV